jgi:hypothetical protein
MEIAKTGKNTKAISVYGLESFNYTISQKKKVHFGGNF